MLKQGYTSIHRVIENVIRDTGFTTEINWVDVAEWVYIAMELIGVTNAYVRKITDGNDGNPEPIEIIDYKGNLPSDFHQIIAVRDYNTKIALSESSSLFFNSNNRAFSTFSEHSYKISNDLIFTSFESGSLEIEYWAFPIDEDGLPLIPDDVTYLKAIESYITERIARKLMIQDKMDFNKYRLFEREWAYYVNSANTKDSLMSLDKAEALRNQLTKIIGTKSLFKRSFDTLSNSFNTDETGIIKRKIF